MASKLKDKDKRPTETNSGDEAHAQQMIEFRRRAERISRSLEGRKHTDSAKLLREDRAR
jgi:hypothetical protein